MLSNYAVVEKFYQFFQQLNANGMNECYAEHIIFSDPVFGLLKDDEVKSMWQMLCKNAQNFSLEFSDIKSIDEEYITCNWTATYTFSGTGNKVVNHATAFMRINNEKIIEHSDGFRLSNWIGQALGWKGKLFGWMNWMKTKVQKNAKQKLLQFMQNKK